MADEETLKAHLEEAEQALHRLRLGERVVEVEYEGHRSKFSPASTRELVIYIRELKRKLGEPVAPRFRRVRF